jgi:hypothetical protein
MLTNLDILLSRLKDAEYSYLLLEPLPLFGLFFGLIFFCVGLYMKQPKARIVALVVIAVACGSVFFYAKLRNRAMPRILATREISYLPHIKEQSKLRADTKWIYYVTAIVAVVALIGGGKLGALGNYGVLATGTLALLFSLWLHMKEAQVYHPNIIKGSVRTR